jgi:ribosomal protein S7
MQMRQEAVAQVQFGLFLALVLAVEHHIRDPQQQELQELVEAVVEVVPHMVMQVVVRGIHTVAVAVEESAYWEQDLAVQVVILAQAVVVALVVLLDPLLVQELAAQVVLMAQVAAAVQL